MVSVNKTIAGENKKKVTFSICTEKSDCSAKLPKDTRLESCLLNCVSRNVENKHRPTHITHKKASVFSVPRHSVGKVCNVKKTLVRNVEQALPPQCMLIRRKETIPLEVRLQETDEYAVTETKTAYKSRYATPELYSSLCIAKEIQTTTNKPVTKHTDIPKAAKQILDEKILSRLNFPLEEKLYKDLISLSISEEELIGRDEQTGNRKEVKFRSRDPEPKLSDFFTPSKGKEYVVVPDPPPSKPEKIRKYNGFSLYQRSQQWNRYK